MADITRLARLLNGIPRGIETSSNTIVLSSLKLGTTELTKTILDKLLLINAAADVDGTYDSRYYTETEVDTLLSNQKNASAIDYDPSNVINWNGTVDPGQTDDALDQLASRAKSLETSTSSHIANTSNPHLVTKSQVLTGNLIVNSDIDAAAAIATSKLADATLLGEAVTFFGNTNITGAEAEILTNGSNADSLHTHSTNVLPMIAGEGFAANTTYAVRLAVSGETVGRVYNADFDASVSNKFYAIGLITSAIPLAAGDTVNVAVGGIHTLGSSDVNFGATEIGEAVHIKAAGTWDSLSQIVYTDNQASYRIGMVFDTNKILLNGTQLLGIQ